MGADMHPRQRVRKYIKRKELSPRSRAKLAIRKERGRRRGHSITRRPIYEKVTENQWKIEAATPSGIFQQTGLHGNNPKTVNSVWVPTYTIPLATVGTQNLTELPA